MHEACSNLAIVGLLIDSRLSAVVIAIETVLERERVGHLELFPDYDSSCSNLARVNDKAAIWKAYKLRPARE